MWPRYPYGPISPALGDASRQGSASVTPKPQKGASLSWHPICGTGKKGVWKMRILILVCWLTGVSLLSPAFAQDKSWLQIEAQPSLNTAMDRARAYSSIFPDVEGYRLKTGWYGIGLGPMTRDAAGARLLDLRRQNLIPADSYISDGKSFADRFWPVGADAATPDVAPPDAAAASAATPDTATPDVAAPAVPAVQPEPAAPPPEPEETAKQAKAAEAALPPEDRMAVQDALKWYGFYDGKVDGHIGAGTRTSMAAWQTAQTYDPTGVLTSKQRAELVGGFKSDKAEFGFEQVTEAESGIEITLPMALIGFDRYEPPFVHYTEKNGSALKVLLISEPGGASSLAGLYSILQTLELVPPNGERALKDGAFTIHGANDKIETLAYAASVDGNIKGYLLSWRVSDAARMARVLPVVQNSFRSLGDKAMIPVWSP